MGTFDLGQMKREDTTDVNVVDPTDLTPTGIVVKVYGADSEKARAVETAQRNRRLRVIQATGGARRMKAEEYDKEGLDLLVECTAGWSGVVENGEPLEFNSANVRSVYERHPWLREQVDKAVADRSLFFKKQPSAS